MSVYVESLNRPEDFWSFRSLPILDHVGASQTLPAHFGVSETISGPLGAPADAQILRRVFVGLPQFRMPREPAARPKNRIKMKQ